MKQYLDAGRDILANGNRRGDRTGTGTVSVFGRQHRYDLAVGFPLLTSKKMFVKGIIHELLWFLQGDTSNNTLVDNGVHIWDEWALDYSVDFPMSSREFANLLTKDYPEKLEVYLEYEKQHANHISGVTDAPMLDLWQVQQWAKENNISAMKKKPILSLDDRIHWMIGMVDPVISKQINYEYCLNGVQKRNDAGVIAKLDGLGVPLITPEHGNLGPVYGKQWRSWEGKVLGDSLSSYPDGSVDIDRAVYEKHDQIAELIHNLKTKPFSRRHVISAWNVVDLPDETKTPQENVKNDKMALAPCHCLFQFYVDEIPAKQRINWIRENMPEVAADIDQQLKDEITAGKFTSEDDDDWDQRLINRNYELYGAVEGVPRRLSCQLYQRSADYCLGVPYNIASYALLTMMIAQCCDMVPGEFIHTFGDLHMYSNHVNKFVTEQLPREGALYVLPTMVINPEVKDIFSFKFEDFKLQNYMFHDKVEYDISV